MKPSAKKQQRKLFVTDADETTSPLTITSNQSLSKPAPRTKAVPVVPSSSGTDSPRPAGIEKPVLASQSYNELLDKYCFVRTHEHRWTA
jgi:hypothetical protein